MDPHLGLREWVKVRKKQTGRYFLCSTAACEGATKKIVEIGCDRETNRVRSKAHGALFITLISIVTIPPFDYFIRKSNVEAAYSSHRRQTKNPTQLSTLSM